jgi:serine/threonine protein phosphatase PrpC
LIQRYAVRSDLGLVRTNNEDSVYAGPRLLAIADGMGGHAAGEVASKIVIGTMEPLDEDRRIDDLTTALRTAVADANHGIADAVKQRKELEGMGTTLTALRFVGSKVGLVHVGDSRAYLLRNGSLSQITHDDTYVQYLVDSGKLTPEEAKDHPRRSVILRALLGTEVDPDVSIREARHGDRYLLCSDGLSDVVTNDTIQEAMLLDEPQDAADRLVELALRGGGPDNVTVIVADVINARVGDRIDDVPVIAGAFVDPAAAEIPSTDSAAGRAASLGRPRPEPEVAEPVATRRKLRWRPWLIVAGVLVLLAGALGAFYAWTQTQYFVGRNGDTVAIFRGVDTDIGPISFYSVYENEPDIRFDKLSQVQQMQVSDGVTADDKANAMSIVKTLRCSVAPNLASCPKTKPVPTPPVCPTTPATTTPTPTLTPTPPPRRSSPHRSPSTSKRAHSSHHSTPAKRTSTHKKPTVGGSHSSQQIPEPGPGGGLSSGTAANSAAPSSAGSC